METKGIRQVLKSLGGVISKNSPTILTGLAVGGLVTTVIFAVKATPRAFALMETELDARLRRDPDGDTDPIELSKREIVRLTWKCYIPAACVGAATIACIIGANAVNKRRNAAIAAAYGLTELAFREYKDKVLETIGRNKELKVRDDISADKLKNNPIGASEVIFTGKGEVLCYDAYSGRYFKSDIEKIRQSVNELNKEFLNDMWMNLNDLYFALGLAPVKLGDQLGWDIDKGLIEVSFSSHLAEDGNPCLVLNYDIQPKFI